MKVIRNKLIVKEFLIEITDLFSNIIETLILINEE
jgi:hypothetical protein